jgi:LmbE family N-acetylglucosaminyl deacetylase
MLTDRERLRRRAAQPRLVSLYRALSRLRSTVTVMNTGAHPDDEQSGMLAVMRHQMGMRVVVACSTRGEGGQNTLGPERGGALGVLRSRELEEAARTLDADIAWLGYGPDDSVHDFGFSKSSPDTLARWNDERTIDRLVRAYRQFRPDIVIPTFLDVPGQHGHHRAMTQAAERALTLAADPLYVTDGLAPWRVAKFYLPAWSGGGDTYDDEVPPPPATTYVEAAGLDIATGMSYDRLGETSRIFHASQNMGHWRDPAQSRWALHHVGGSDEASIGDGLPAGLADLGPSAHLAAADVAIAEALAAFPDSDAIRRALSGARRSIRAAAHEMGADARDLHGHRLTRKLAEIDVAIAQAGGIEVLASISAATVAPGGTIDLIVEAERGPADNLSITPIINAEVLDAADTLRMTEDRTTIPLTTRVGAPIRNAYRNDWQSLGGNGDLSLLVEATIDDETIRFVLDTEEDLQLAPTYQVTISPDAIILPLSATGSRTVTVKADIDFGRIAVGPAAGLAIEQTDGALTLTPNAGLLPGKYTLPVQVDGANAYAADPIAYPHIGRTRFIRPLALSLLALDLVVPDARVGYIGGGSDRVGLWLERMGAKVTELDAAALSGDLSGFDTIVVGIFAFGTRPDLAAGTRKLHAWVETGGHLVTLYHRPGDGWTPTSTPPRPIIIGSPSLRWRVTNPGAPVTFLRPEHPLFAGPNRITADDFAAWDKERGLYFASAWDQAYEPLLSMSDAGEAPLNGSLLSGRIGKGRHTHTSLVLHHQLDKLVPGAFRLMANLLQSA